MNTKSEHEVKVRVGLHHLDDEAIASKTYDVEKIHLHDFSTPSKPGINSGSDELICKKKKKKKFFKFLSFSERPASPINPNEPGDIAILKLTRPIKFIEGMISLLFFATQINALDRKL